MVSGMTTRLPGGSDLGFVATSVLAAAGPAVHQNRG